MERGREQIKIPPPSQLLIVRLLFLTFLVIFIFLMAS